MNKSSSIRLFGALALGAIVVFLAVTLFYPSAGKTPEFKANTVEGKEISSATLKDKVVLVSFWATNCATCIQEMPMLKELHHKYQAQGYETLAVAMNYDKLEYIRTYIDRNTLPFQVVHDADQAIAKAFEKVQLTPTNFLLNKNGEIIKFYIGIPDPKDIQKAIETALAESPKKVSQTHFTGHPLLAASALMTEGQPVIEVWKNPNCGCCGEWIKHLESNGFVVKAHDTYELPKQRAKLGMPEKYASCHSATVDGYVIEGHVPAQDIQRLLQEKPVALGLSVPGMPLGSPGMDGKVYKGKKDAFDTLLISKNKQEAAQVFQHYPGN